METNSVIGLFSEVYPPIMDGVAIAVQNYHECLVRKGVGNVVITPSFPNSAVDDKPEVLRYFSIPSIVRPPYRVGLPDVDYPFHKRIQPLCFSIMHTHSPFSSGRLALKIARKQNIPLIATFHSKYRDDFARYIKSKWILDRVVKNITDFYNAADEVWVPQASVKEVLREYGYKGPIEVVENGTDYTPPANMPQVKYESRAKLGIHDDDLPVLLYVGQHVWEKNLHFVLEILERLQETPFKMFFVGEGYARAQMMDFVEERGLAGKVTFTGVVRDREALKQYYAAADLFLFPSLYDNASLVLREAAAFHTPAIILKESTIAEVVRHNYNGFLSEPDLAAFTFDVKTIMTNKLLLSHVGKAASQTLTRTWDNVVDEVIDRYKHLQLRKAQNSVVITKETLKKELGLHSNQTRTTKQSFAGAIEM